MAGSRKHLNPGRNPVRPPLLRGRALLLWGLLLAAASGQSPAPGGYQAKAHLTDIQVYTVREGRAQIPGAAMRAFQNYEDLSAAERQLFEIRWYANPPGIPPGAVLLLETRQERRQTVKNHIVRTTVKSEGHQRTLIEIPAALVRQAGRVTQWRLRVIWRGRVLAGRASPNWEG